MSSSVIAVDRYQDESALDRLVKSHRLAIVSVFLGALSGFLCYIKIDGFTEYWPWLALAAVAVLILSALIDPLLAVWSRWPIVAADVGLIGRRGGVPARWAIYPAGWRSVALVVSPGSILPEEWEKRAPGLARGFGYERAVLTQDRKRVRLLFTNEASPLDCNYSRPLALDNQKILIGVDESGSDYWLDTSGHSGMMVAGLPGSGKTVFLDRTAQTFAEDPENLIAIFDGKGTNDFAHLAAENVWVFSGTPGSNLSILDALERLTALMEERKKKAEAGEVLPGRIVIFVDECHGFFATAKGLNKEEKQARERATKILRDFIALGRSLGFFTVLATQKPDAESLPTVVRDNAGLRVSGGLRTSEAEKMILGENLGLTRSLAVGQMVIDDGKNIAIVKVAIVEG